MADQELDDLALNIEEELRALEAVSTAHFGGLDTNQLLRAQVCVDDCVCSLPDLSLSTAPGSDKLTRSWIRRRAWEQSSLTWRAQSRCAALPTVIELGLVCLWRLKRCSGVRQLIYSLP